MQGVEYWFRLSEEAQAAAVQQAQQNWNRPELESFREQMKKEVARKKQLRRLWGADARNEHRRILTDEDLEFIMSAEDARSCELRLNDVLLKKNAYREYVAHVAKRLSRKRGSSSRQSDEKVLNGLGVVVKHAKTLRLSDGVAKLELCCPELRKAGQRLPVTLYCPALVERIHDRVLHFLPKGAFAALSCGGVEQDHLRASIFARFP